MPLHRVDDPDAQDRHQQHALRGAEVAAVHPGEHTAGHTHQTPCSAMPPRASARAATRSGSAGRGSPARSRARSAPARSRRTRPTGSQSSSSAPTTPPISEAAPEPDQPGALAASSRAVADRTGQRARHQADRVGHVGRHRRDAERQQGRERDQRSRPHHGVDGSGRHACEQDGDDLPETHCPAGCPPAGSPGSAPAVSAGVWEAS